MMPCVPVFDPRDQQALLAELLARVPGFAAAWKPGAGEPSWALLSVYARYLEILGEGINRLPERSLLSFLDTFGNSLLTAQSSRAPLVFKLLDTSPRDVELPAKSVVAAKLPPPPPSLLDPDPQDARPAAPLFYTAQTVMLTRAKLQALYSIDPGTDHYTDHIGDVRTGFVALASRDPVPHILYVGHDRVFALAGTAEVVLSFAMAGATRTLERKVVLVWEYLSQDGWLPLAVAEDTTARFTVDGKIRLTKGCGPDAKEDVVDGRKSYWIRARVSADPPRANVD